MKIFSVKKYFSIFMLILAGMSRSVSMDAAAIKILQGFPYKPLWDLAVITKKQGIQQVSNALMKPPVVYYAVPGAIAYAAWSYCEIVMWQLERQKVKADTAEKSARRKSIAQMSALINTNSHNSVRKQRTIAKHSRSSQASLKKYKTLTQVELQLCKENDRLEAARTTRLNRLWWMKWASLGVGSLAFMMTYKVWPKNNVNNA